jgi:Transcription factor TFIIH complex subunit Tfb5
MSSRTKSAKQRQGAGGKRTSPSTSSKGRKGSGTLAPSSSKPLPAVAKPLAAASEDSPSAGYLISCDVPTKQFIQYLNELKSVDKKFILQDLDSTHLLVKLSCRQEIEKKVEDWLNENVFSAIEKVGEDLDVS